VRIRRRDLTGALEPSEVDLTPLMCLFIILVPMLLITAVFERLSSLKVNLPPASTLETTDPTVKEPTGVVELRLTFLEEGLALEGTLSHDPEGRQKEVYEDFSYPIPLREGQYDLPELQRTLLSLKAQYPRHENIVFLVDDRILYDLIVQAMDTCREENVLEEGERKSRPLFPNISLSEAFDEAKGFDGLRLGTREIDQRLGTQ